MRRRVVVMEFRMVDGRVHAIYGEVGIVKYLWARLRKRLGGGT